MLSLVGWLATVVFSSSYFCREPTKLRWIQASAAIIWVIYGVLIGAMPVVVANIIVAAAAVYTSLVANRQTEKG